MKDRISTAPRPQYQTTEQEECDHSNITYTGSDFHNSLRIERGECDDCGQTVATVWESAGTEEIAKVSNHQIVNDFRDAKSERWSTDSEDTDSLYPSYDIPDEYDDVDPALVPLFDTPHKWFCHIMEAYETALGYCGTVVDLTPEAVVFQATVVENPGYITDIFQKYVDNEYIGETRMVPNEESAESGYEPRLWVTRKGPEELFINERVPFNQYATTTEELRAELSDVLHSEPNWESLFESTREAVDN